MMNFQGPLLDPGLAGPQGNALPEPMDVQPIGFTQPEYQGELGQGTPPISVRKLVHTFQHKSEPPSEQRRGSHPNQNQQGHHHQSHESPPSSSQMGPSSSSQSPRPSSTSSNQHRSPVNMDTSTLISSSMTPELQRKLQDKTKFSAIFIPENHLSIPWQHSPTDYSWKWENSSYVKLPMSSEWTKRRVGSGPTVNVPRWLIIQEQLINLRESCQSSRKISKEIKEVVASYNGKLAQVCNYEILNDKELAKRLPRVLPFIIDYCLEMPYKLRKSIPILKKGQWRTIYLTRGLCASLLANAFLCTIPHQDRNPKELPHFHFLKLFHDGSEGPARAQVKVEKIKCILEYFEQMSKASKNEKDAIISFERRFIPHHQNWSQSNKNLCKVWPNNDDTIEDAEGLLQADFANKYIGGGILSVGMVQEEIRFATCPDLIASRLFTEVLGDNEVMIITGAKQFSAYQGYRTTFEWEKMKKPQKLDRDDLGREMVQLVAMDALFFKKGTESSQYQKHKIDRELHKCNVAFKMGKKVQEVATGNWGCGAFNGDPQLKFIIQWMATTEVGRPAMVYYTVGSNQQFGEVSTFFNHVSKKKVTVGKMYKILESYEKNGNINGRKPTPVFDFVLKNI